MATRPPGRPLPAMVAHALELLAGSGTARSRAMFGGHGLYLDGVFVALVADEVLYLKVDAETQDQFAAAGGRPFVYTGGDRPLTMSYWTVPEDALDAPASLGPWARLALAAGLRARAGPSRPSSRPKAVAKRRPAR